MNGRRPSSWFTHLLITHGAPASKFPCYYLKTKWAQQWAHFPQERVYESIFQ